MHWTKECNRCYGKTYWVIHLFKLQSGYHSGKVTWSPRTEIICLGFESSSVFLSISFSGLMIHQKLKCYVWLICNWLKIIFTEGPLEVYCISHWRQWKKNGLISIRHWEGCLETQQCLLWQKMPVEMFSFIQLCSVINSPTSCQ